MPIFSKNAKGKKNEVRKEQEKHETTREGKGLNAEVISTSTVTLGGETFHTALLGIDGGLGNVGTLATVRETELGNISHLRQGAIVKIEGKDLDNLKGEDVKVVKGEEDLRNSLSVKVDAVAPSDDIATSPEDGRFEAKTVEGDEVDDKKDARDENGNAIEVKTKFNS